MKGDNWRVKRKNSEWRRLDRGIDGVIRVKDHRDLAD